MPLGNQLGHFAIEKGQQQRRDMGAVHIGVGHDDDPLIAQIAALVFGSQPATQRLHQIGQLLVRLHLAGACAGDVEDFSPQRQDRLGVAVARLLGAAARAVAFDQENLGAFSGIAGAVGQLAGQAQLARRRLAGNFFFLAAAQARFGFLDDEIEQLARVGGAFCQPVIEMVADDGFDQLLGFG